jgi:hypothetical protein
MIRKIVIRNKVAKNGLATDKQQAESQILRRISQMIFASRKTQGICGTLKIAMV